MFFWYAVCYVHEKEYNFKKNICTLCQRFPSAISCFGYLTTVTLLSPLNSANFKILVLKGLDFLNKYKLQSGKQTLFSLKVLTYLIKYYMRPTVKTINIESIRKLELSSTTHILSIVCTYVHKYYFLNYSKALRCTSFGEWKTRVAQIKNVRLVHQLHVICKGKIG